MRALCRLIVYSRSRQSFLAVILLIVSIPGFASCGVGGDVSSKYDRQLVRRSGDTLEDAKVYIVRDHKKHWITNSRWIVANGFNWPADVHVISADELGAIPTGEPISASH